MKQTKEEKLAYLHAWRQRFPEKWRTANAIWRENNKEYVLAYEKERAAKRKAERHARRPVLADYEIAAIEKFKIEKERWYQRNWKRGHPQKPNLESGRRRTRLWRERNPIRYAEVTRANHHKRRARKKASSGNFSAQEWRALKEKYDYRCLCCQRTESELVEIGLKLAADHILPLSKGGSNLISNIQPLCQGSNGCNNKKFVKHIDYRPQEVIA